MKALNFNNWNRINEEVIDWKDHEGLQEFYDDASELLELYRERANVKYLELNDLKAIGDHNGIEIVTYDEFLDELPEEAKHTAPPRKAGLFALVNPETQRPRVVISIPKIDKRALDHIFHMLKHESIHIEQFKRRGDIETPMNDPHDQEKYFSNKDEVMAFSHSIADMLISSGKYDNIEDAIGDLDTLRLYNTIKKNVSDKILKRYHKYIYAYLLKEIQ